MSRLDFTPYRRTTVGFDRLFDLLENAGRTMQSDNSPPFNIERIADDRYLITVAVAGFTPAEIDITAQQKADAEASSAGEAGGGEPAGGAGDAGGDDAGGDDAGGDDAGDGGGDDAEGEGLY